MATGIKNIEYNGKKYFSKDIVGYRKNIDLKETFDKGEFTFIETKEKFKISEIETLQSKLDIDSIEALKHSSTYSDRSKIKKKIIDDHHNNLRIEELESELKNDIITIDSLKELIGLKYKDKYKAYINYESYIKINHKIPELSDGDLGKFYKILSKLSHKANTLLTKKDIRSNPVTKEEIGNLLKLDIKPTERYLKRLRDKGIIKQVTMIDKVHLMVNPIYAFNGNTIGSYTYIYFKEDLNEVSDIPEELKLLWEYEYINSTIEG